MLNFLIFLFLIYTSFLNTISHASDGQPPPPRDLNFPTASQGTFPKEYVVPRHEKTDAPMRIQELKTCREYLNICETSCRDRGKLFKFQCIGQEFQPFDNRYHCICYDDLFTRRQVKEKNIVISNGASR